MLFGCRSPRWVATKSSAQQSTLVAAQRLAGALIGAAVASVFLLTVAAKHALEAIVVVLGALGASIRVVNYASPPLRSLDAS
jgi:uncharacterized membrane protein YccC